MMKPRLSRLVVIAGIAAASLGSTMLISSLDASPSERHARPVERARAPIAALADRSKQGASSVPRAQD